LPKRKEKLVISTKIKVRDMTNIIVDKDKSTDVLVQEAKPLLKQPSLFQVVMHNDDYTPMEFVVAVLEKFFSMDAARATNVMYQVHMTGRAVCGVYTKDVAETKMEQVIDYARKHEHPLLCSVEAV
jgi:ATP-dependent Clp protease adaptor protein ClpS